jgi:hypothetical protein
MGKDCIEKLGVDGMETLKCTYRKKVVMIHSWLNKLRNFVNEVLDFEFHDSRVFLQEAHKPTRSAVYRRISRLTGEIFNGLLLRAKEVYICQIIDHVTIINTKETEVVVGYFKYPLKI